MASRARKEVLVIKNLNYGGLPPYLVLAQRHFEKAPPTPNERGNFIVPLDLVRLTLPADGDLVEELVSVEVHYKKAKP